MKSKSKIEKQLQRKTNSVLVETIIAAKKKEKWLGVADIVSSPRRNKKGVNISEIDEKTKEKEILVVPGKVLSQGEMSKKIKIAALGFSEKAKEKLLKAGCEVSDILNEIKKNPEAKGVKILE
jgi:large subunit ribosomal protein L18e